jgi:signal transduction histidine kinase
MRVIKSRPAVTFLAVAALAIAVMASVAFWALSQVSAAADARRHTFRVLLGAEDIVSELKDAETAQRGYLLTGDDAFLEPWVSSRGVVREHLTRLRSTTRSPTARERLDVAAPLLDAKLVELAETIELRRRGDVTAAVARVSLADGKRLMDAFRSEMLGVRQAEAERLDADDAALESTLRRVFVLIGFGCIVAIAGGLALARGIRQEDDHRMAWKALEVENAALVTASRMKSEFLAAMSHELRTPLNGIIGYSEVLHDGLAGAMTERQRGFLATILSSGQHLLSLVNDILDVSKVEAGQMTLDLEVVEISALLANSVSIVQGKASDRGVVLILPSAGDRGSIRADARKLKQIVYNLLSNAVKFTPDGGRVSLDACRVTRAEVGRRSASRGGRSLPLADSAFEEFLAIRVTDNGIGISMEGLESLFVPFMQLDRGLARGFDGTGLGLALVRDFAELHGGAVAVDSAVGEGSCFSVWLPLRPAEGAA